MNVVTRIDEVREALSGARAEGLSVGLVPTMGALHEGHLSLIRRAVDDTDYAVVSNYVNPTQFGPGEDFERYPRDLEADNARCREAGVALVYAPRTEELYPPGHATWVEVTGVSETLEGLARPGHFRGVATVVAKLLCIVRPDVAYFGRKDAQQSALVRRLVRDLCLPVRVVEMPTVRDADGLALSSRNRYLSPGQRRHALCLVRALRLAEDLVATGTLDAAAITHQMRGVIQSVPAATIDYVALVDPETFLARDHLEGPTLIVAAITIAGAHLIDNTLVTPPAGPAPHKQGAGG
jgi:pantoate--beta-alanine ligase